MPVRFVLDSMDVTTKSPDYGDKTEEECLQAKGVTYSGGIIVSDRGIFRRKFFLSFRALSDTEKDDLSNFFGPEGTCGSLREFTYIDHNNKAWTARLVSDSIEWTCDYDGLWSTDIILEVTPSEAS